MLGVIAINSWALTQSPAGRLGGSVVLAGTVLIPALYLLTARIRITEDTLIVRTPTSWRRVPLSEVSGVALFRLRPRRSPGVAVIHGGDRAFCTLSRRFWSDSTILRLRAAIHGSPAPPAGALAAGTLVSPRDLEGRYRGSTRIWWRRPTISAVVLVFGSLLVLTPAFVVLGFH